MAPQARKFEFVISGSSNDAVDALRKLAEAGKNTGGELGKAGRALEKALGEGSDGIAKSKAAAKAGENIGKTMGSRASDAFGKQLRESIGDSLTSALPGDFFGGVLEQFGGAEVALGGIQTAALGVAAAYGAAAIAAGAFLTASVGTYTDLVAQARELSELSGLSASEAIPLVDVLQRFGLTAKDTSQVLIQLSGQLKGNTLKELQSYGVEVEKAADGTTDLAATFYNVIDAIQALPDASRRNQLAQLAFGEDDAVKLLPLLRLTREELQKLIDTAVQGGDEDIAALAAWERQSAELAQTWRALKFEAGRTVLPALTELLSVINAIAESPIGDVFDQILESLGRWAEIATLLPRELFGDDDSKMAAPITRSGEAMLNLGQETEKTKVKAVDLSNVFDNLADKLSASAQAFRTFTADERASISTATGLQNAWATLDDALASRNDTTGRAAEAITSLAEAEAEAAENVAKARADAAESLADVERQASERIADAQDRVTEARERATRAAEDSARRVRDAQQALVDAVVRSAGEDNPFEALRMREQAQQDLADAEVDAARDQEDARKGVADAEQDLADTVVDAARDRERAQRDAAERIADAEEAAADRISAAQKAVQDAVAVTTERQRDYSGSLQDVVDKTFDAAYWAREHGASQEEVQAIVDTSRTKVEAFAAAMGLSADETEELVKQLGLIPSQIELNFVMRMNMKEFEDARKKAAEAFTDPVSKAMVESGVAFNEGGVSIVPQFAGGGMFKSSVPGGAGLAVLHDGERVLTPQQQTGVNVTIQAGTLVHERDLPALLDSLKRRGFM